jgi:hypothetical protein
MRDTSAVLSAGDELQFGRDVDGVGRIIGGFRRGRSVSRVHGVVHATATGYAVTSTGRYFGFTVADRTTPSRLYVPVGIGPVAVPFAESSIIIEFADLESTAEHRLSRARLDVSVDGSETAWRWKTGWGVDIENRWARQPHEGMGTQKPHFLSKFLLANGRHRACFKTLVALCEPSLGEGDAGTPTNSELARRLGCSEKIIERHLSEIYERVGVLYDARPRESAAALAVNRGLVTREHLHLLPPPHQG